MPHAVVAVYHHPRETWAQQKQFFHDRIVPMTRSRPGFVSGTWSYGEKDSRSFGYVLFDSEQNARALEAVMRAEAERPNPLGVAPLSIDVVEVLAEAFGP